MRHALADREGQRKKFSAVFTRFGSKINYKGYAEQTVLLTGVVELDTGTMVSDHIWLACTKGFEQADLKAGDAIEFEARVKVYKKGYRNRTIRVNLRKTDYKLSHPTKIKPVRK